MKADEATEFMDVEKPKDTFKQRAAIFIAFLAMLLAITGLGGQNASKETLNNNIQAANAFNFFQAKNIRQTSLILAVDEIELAWAATPASARRRRRRLRRSWRPTRSISPATSPNPPPARARKS